MLAPGLYSLARDMHAFPVHLELLSISLGSLTQIQYYVCLAFDLLSVSALDFEVWVHGYCTSPCPMNGP